jgi:hypothetical protein
VLGLRANGTALTTLPVLANVGTSGGTMVHVASGAGWNTIFTLVNTGTTAADATLSFYHDDGTLLSLPLSFPQTGATATDWTVSQTIPAGATVIIVTAANYLSDPENGSAQLITDGNVGGFAIFQYFAALNQQQVQEAVVPMETGSANSYTLAFDNTGSLATGIALANGIGQPAGVFTTLRDATGTIMWTTTINLPADGHLSEMLEDLFPASEGIRGTVEFDTPVGGQIGALGIRATAAGAYTTIPVMMQ